MLTGLKTSGLTEGEVKLQRSYAARVFAEQRKFLKGRKEDPTVYGLLSAPGLAADVTEWVSTGFIELDDIFGGGWPVGRMSELMGPEASGKSAEIHMALLQNQLQGGVPELIDGEYALDKKKMARMARIGIDPQAMLYYNPTTFEHAADQLEDRLRKMREFPPPSPSVIAWDTVTSTPTAAEMAETSIADSQVASQARLISKLLRKTVGPVCKTRAALILVSQERETMNKARMGAYQEPGTTGGRAPKYYASLRVRNTRVQTFKRGPISTGYLIQSVTKKSRLVPPHRRAKWVLDFRLGPSPELTTFHNLLDGKVVKSAGGKYSCPWHEGFTRDAWVGLMDDPSFCKKAQDASLDVIRRGLNVPTYGTSAEDDVDEGIDGLME